MGSTHSELIGVNVIELVRFCIQKGTVGFQQRAACLPFENPER